MLRRPNLERSWRLAAILLPLTSAVAVGGCASAPGIGPAASVAPAGYQLDEKEQKLSCKDLTGRMRVRILQIRDANAGRDGTVAARGMQVAATSVFGGGKEGTDPSGQNARDRAQLEAYNRRLAEQKCKTFDLNAELQPKAFHETPTPR